MNNNNLTKVQEWLLEEAEKVAVQTCEQDIHVLDEEIARFVPLQEHYENTGEEEKVSLIVNKLNELIESRGRRIAMLSVQTEEARKMFFHEYMVRYL